MSEWHIGVAKTSSYGSPAFSLVRPLSPDEYNRLSSALTMFRNIIHRTVWGIQRTNYATFCEVERGIGDTNSGLTVSDEAVGVLVSASIANFLSSMRMLLDLSQAELKRSDKETGLRRFEPWNNACSAEYDDYFAYRFLYRFRNYVQHCGLPLNAWSVSSSMKNIDELAAQVEAGRPPSEITNGTVELTGRIFLAQSPAFLVEAFDWGQPLTEELKSLTTEIDISDQIHVGMECLTRIDRAFMESFKPELAQSVEAFNEVVGDLHNYAGSPLLMKTSTRQQGANQFIEMTTSDLEISRFLVASQITADGPRGGA